jgi:natural product precursor
MKSKAFNKKLSLNRKTIANLNNKEMKRTAGGFSGTKCPSICCVVIHECPDLTSI